MILYDLRCDKGHVFEAWFRSSDSFADQVASGEVACAVCGSAKLEKAPMAPRLGKGGSDPEADKVSLNADATEKGRDLRRKLEALRDQVEKNCDYVGPSFAEEARKIHYGEAEARGIYGESTDEESKALAEEGVPFTRIPWPRKGDA